MPDHIDVEEVLTVLGNGEVRFKQICVAGDQLYGLTGDGVVYWYERGKKDDKPGRWWRHNLVVGK